LLSKVAVPVTPVLVIVKLGGSELAKAASSW